VIDFSVDTVVFLLAREIKWGTIIIAPQKSPIGSQCDMARNHAVRAMCCGLAAAAVYVVGERRIDMGMMAKRV